MKTHPSMNKWIKNNLLVEKICRYFSKHLQTAKEVKIVDTIKNETTDKRYQVAIYESELRMIGLDSASWETETGGDLFGVWLDIPVIYLASLAGPNVVRNHAHFRLDVEYLIKLSAKLEADWGLRYFGDWHSHHNLGLLSPSTGDKKRIVGVSNKNNFDGMAEFIITFENDGHNSKMIKINPYAYLDLPSTKFTDIELIVLKGISPVRSTLIQQSLLPEQKLSSFPSFPMSDLVAPYSKSENEIAVLDTESTRMTEKLITHLRSYIENVLGRDIEIHKTDFGFILVVQIEDNKCIAFALGKEWPNEVLQVNWLDRSNGSSTEIDVKISILNVKNFKELEIINLEVKI